MTFVYLIEARNGLIKIGCSQNPIGRAATVATHSPVPTRLVAMWPGAKADEHALHIRFRDFRQHLEWFCVVGPVADFLQENFGKGLASVSDWAPLLFWSPEHGRESGVARRRASVKRLFADPEYRRKHAIKLRFSRVNRAAIADGTRPEGSALRVWVNEVMERVSAEYDAAEAVRHRRRPNVEQANLRQKVA